MRTATRHRVVLMLATIMRSRLFIDMRRRVRKHVFKYTYGDRMVIERILFQFWICRAKAGTHLLAVADTLLFEAQFPLQVLDDGVLGSLNVRIGDGARGLGDGGPLGEGFAEKAKQKGMSASAACDARPLSQDSSFLCGSL